MGKTLTEIAQDLINTNKKVQLIYAFNGTGKTRLSREFKQLIAPRADDNEGDDEADRSELVGKKNSVLQRLYRRLVLLGQRLGTGCRSQAKNPA